MNSFDGNNDIVHEALGRTWEDVQGNLAQYGSIDFTPEDLLTLVKIIRAEKREKHIHFDGSVNYETLKHFGFPGEKSDLVAATNQGLDKYLEPFLKIAPYMQTQEHLRILAEQFVFDQYKEGITSTEVRYDPHLHMQEWLTIAQVMKQVFLGFEDGVNALERRIKVEVILWLDRSLDPLEAREISSEMLAFLHEQGRWKVWMSGFDLNCAEIWNPPLKHRQTLLDWKKECIPLVIHAGEELSSDTIDRSAYVKQALDIGVARIGHGVLCADSPQVIDRIWKTNTQIEICFSSNLQTGTVRKAEDHPLKRYIEKGLLLSINTDNKTVGNMTLSEEILLIHKLTGISLETLLKISSGQWNRDIIARSP